MTPSCAARPTASSSSSRAWRAQGVRRHQDQAPRGGYRLARRQGLRGQPAARRTVPQAGHPAHLRGRRGRVRAEDRGARNEGFSIGVWASMDGTVSSIEGDVVAISGGGILRRRPLKRPRRKRRGSFRGWAGACAPAFLFARSADLRAWRALLRLIHGEKPEAPET